MFHAPKPVRRTTMGPYVVPTRKRSSGVPTGAEESTKPKCMNTNAEGYKPSWQYSPSEQTTAPVIRRSVTSRMSSRKEGPIGYPYRISNESRCSSFMDTPSSLQKQVRPTRSTTLPVFNSRANKTAHLPSFAGIPAVIRIRRDGGRIAVLYSSNGFPSPPISPMTVTSAGDRLAPPVRHSANVSPRFHSLRAVKPERSATLVADETYDYSMHDFGTQPREIWSSDSLMSRSNPQIGHPSRTTQDSGSTLRSLLVTPAESSSRNTEAMKLYWANSGRQ